MLVNSRDQNMMDRFFLYKDILVYFSIYYLYIFKRIENIGPIDRSIFYLDWWNDEEESSNKHIKKYSYDNNDINYVNDNDKNYDFNTKGYISNSNNDINKNVYKSNARIKDSNDNDKQM